MAATDVIAFVALRRHEGLLSVDALQKLEGRRMTSVGGSCIASVIDELGFVPLSKTGAELLFELI